MRPHLVFQLAGNDPDEAVLALLGATPSRPAEPARELERRLQMLHPLYTCLIAVGPALEIHSGPTRVFGAEEGEALLSLYAAVAELRCSCTKRVRAGLRA